MWNHQNSKFLAQENDSAYMLKYMTNSCIQSEVKQPLVSRDAGTNFSPSRSSVKCFKMVVR